MPIKADSKSYKNFQAAVQHFMKKKGWTKKRASAYVAGIEDRQSPGWRSK